MTVSSFDPDQLTLATRKLSNAAAALRDLTTQLSAIPNGAIVRPVSDRLEDLKNHSQQMISDIGLHTDQAAYGLLQVAMVYRDLNESIINAFSGGQ
jgi:hypothetical protein